MILNCTQTPKIKKKYLKAKLRGWLIQVQQVNLENRQKYLDLPKVFQQPTQKDDWEKI